MSVPLHTFQVRGQFKAKFMSSYFPMEQHISQNSFYFFSLSLNRSLPTFKYLVYDLNFK